MILSLFLVKVVSPRTDKKKFQPKSFPEGLIGLTLDKESILMVEIDEILSRDAPDSLNQDGKIQVSLKTTAKAKVVATFIDFSSKIWEMASFFLWLFCRGKFIFTGEVSDLMQG